MAETSRLDPPYIVTKEGRTYYVGADGSAWRVRDTVWKDRRHHEVTLERHLRSAQFLPTQKEDKGAYSLSEGARRVPTFADPRSGHPDSPRRWPP
jgi:hypothetical protein